MKQLLQTLLCLFFTAHLSAQITSPQIKANFGVDADLRTNYFNGAIIGTSDEWFSAGDAGSGISVIDTTGAAAIVDGYTSNPSSLNNSFIRNMSYPAFSVVNSNLLMDAVFVRDFHGGDSTVFASGANKNGQSPVLWSTPIAQSVPAKNEILDVFMHVRRAGIIASDSLWMFGGISIENTTGNRYFDFEMYQSDIFYNRSTLSFTGYGPDEGHTSWDFNDDGTITKPGDIILTAEYSSSALTFIEARIWINKDALAITPVNFNWSGQFDGASNGAQYGYASIVPKTAGAFYTGLQSDDNTWGGPFKIVLGNNSVVDNYNARQFMEFSVNLTKLGLDPVTILGGSTCDRPFQKVLVKTRASTSFTAELKDFVGPFDFFRTPSVNLFTDVPVFCGMFGVSNLKVINPVSTYTYNWSTTDGHFSDTTNKASVYVDAPGTYIIAQKLNSGCPVSAVDTIVITFDAACGILANNLLHFTGILVSDKVNLSWQIAQNEQISFYTIERSTDGIHYFPAAKVYPDKYRTGLQNLLVVNVVSNVSSAAVYYRLKIYSSENGYKYSPIIKIDLAADSRKPLITIAPNPITDLMLLNIFSQSAKKIEVKIYDGVGRIMRSVNTTIEQGKTSINLSGFQNWPQGIYTVKVFADNDVTIKRILISK